MLIEDIQNYLDYLKNVCKLYVSVHFRAERFHALPRKLFLAILPYNSHTNLYCMDVKSKKSNVSKCIASQHCVYNMKDRRENFFRVCYAGVYEYITPVYEADTVIGYIAVSGYRQAAAKTEIEIDRSLWETHLSAKTFPLTLCRAVIPPLGHMLEELFAQYPENSDNEYLRIVQYLHEYHNAMTLDELCEHFHRSKSYISHLFNRSSGMTLRAYCNALKLEDAKLLLESTSLPITEISFRIGFGDTSYFIKLFRERFGSSPYRYRKQIQSP